MNRRICREKQRGFVGSEKGEQNGSKVRRKGGGGVAPGLTPTAACSAGPAAPGDGRSRKRREGSVRGQRWDERNGGREEEDDFVRLAGAAAPWAAGFQRGREERKGKREVG